MIDVRAAIGRARALIEKVGNPNHDAKGKFSSGSSSGSGGSGKSGSSRSGKSGALYWDEYVAGDVPGLNLSSKSPNVKVKTGLAGDHPTELRLWYHGGKTYLSPIYDGTHSPGTMVIRGRISGSRALADYKRNYT